MSAPNVRWIQRFANYNKALEKLSQFIDKEQLNEFKEQGLIHCFEYNYELAWNVLKDFYEAQGEFNIQGSKDGFRLGFNRGLLKNGDIWMQMVKSRSLTSHTYNADTAREVVQAILNGYYQEFIQLKKKLNEILGGS